MRILLTGKNGQVGFELQRALAPLGEVFGVDQADCDLTDADAIRRLVRQVQPGIIVNPAAYTAVDKAESDARTAFAVNETATAVLGEEALARSIPLVHYSTDYVFDGTKTGAYREDDVPNPQSVYGKSKWAGEQALLRMGVDCLIFRTSWVLGAHGSNFAKTMLKLAAEREQLNIVADQYGAPTSAALIADITAQILGQYLHRPSGSPPFPFGLYHLVAGGETNWCDYARTVISSALAAGKSLSLDPGHIYPITTKEYPAPAPRPANSCLDTCKLKQAFRLELPDWRQGLHHVLQQIL